MVTKSVQNCGARPLLSWQVIAKIRGIGGKRCQSTAIVEDAIGVE